MFAWLVSKRNKRPVPSSHCVAGFVVTEHSSNRVVFREMLDVEGLSAKSVAKIRIRHVATLKRRYPMAKYDVQSCSCNSPDAFDHYYP